MSDHLIVTVVRGVVRVVRNGVHAVVFILAWVGFAELWHGDGLPMTDVTFIIVTVLTIAMFVWSCGVEAPHWGEKRDE